MYRNIIRTTRHLALNKININYKGSMQKTLIQVPNCSFQCNLKYTSKTDNFKQLQSEVTELTFSSVSNETLESLCEFFEELLEGSPELKGTDVTFGDGVLTVNFGKDFGTYVINRQTPNKQIWLSSPKSGPKRYDLIMENDGIWIYKHDGISLHKLLQEEISEILKKPIDFSKCSHSYL